MNHHEKYLFDLRGYIVVRNATTTAQIDDLSTRLEMHRNEKIPYQTTGNFISMVAVRGQVVELPVGPTDGGQCYYRFSNGRFFNGPVAVAFELDTVPSGQGGFACIAGNHKVNFELPSDWEISKQYPRGNL